MCELESITTIAGSRIAPIWDMLLNIIMIIISSATVILHSVMPLID